MKKKYSKTHIITMFIYNVNGKDDQRVCLQRFPIPTYHHYLITSPYCTRVLREFQ